MLKRNKSGTIVLYPNHEKNWLYSFQAARIWEQSHKPINLVVCLFIQKSKNHLEFMRGRHLVVVRKYNLLHFVAFFHVASLFSTGVDNKKVGQTMKKLQSWTTEYSDIEISPKNATKHPVAQWHDHAKHSGLNSIFCCLKMNQF